jgi:hypothetical protein
MTAVTRLLLVALLLALMTPASAQAAGQLTLRDAGPVGPLARSDGQRYIATAKAARPAPVKLLDTATGKWSTVASPPGCSFADAHRGTLLWECDAPDAFESGRTYDLATGSRSELVAPAHDLASWDASRYEAIGARWARVRFFGYHATAVAWIERSTGRLVTQDPGDAFVLDLDRAALLQPLCSGIRRPAVPDTTGLGVVIADDLARAGPWAAATSYADEEDPPGVVELQHCGRAARTLRTCRRFQCSQPVITTRFVAWTENTTHGKLVVRSLSTGRTRTASRSTPLAPLLVGQRLYVKAGGRLLRVAI